MLGPFRILGIQQIVIDGADKNALRRLWVDVLGLTVCTSFVCEQENVDEDIFCSVGHGAHSVEIDLMQPLDPQRTPAIHARPLNHAGGRAA